MGEHKSTELPALPWRFPVALEDIPEEGSHFNLSADTEVRAALARMAELRDLPRLDANFEVKRQGEGTLHVIGRVSATVGQTCVVTLEPIENEIEEDINLVFAPPTAERLAAEAKALIDELGDGRGKKARKRRDEPASISPPIKSSDRLRNEPERLIDGQIDLAALVMEFLMLGINPYPRKPGVVFETPQSAQAEEGPFAALARLTKGRNDH